MAPKQSKPNGFLLFMLDFKKREERQGRKFSGLQEVQADPRCNSEWQSMSPAKKAEYNSRAKQSKPAGKKTGTGENMEDVDRERRKKREFKQTMIDDIESTVALGMEYGNLHTMKFNFIHCNWFYTRALENNEFDYIPAEFAVSEFSLLDGVTNIYHQILKTEILCGYTREAMETSQETHQLPWNLQSGEDRFEVMATNLKEFLKPGMTENKYPPLYTSSQIKAAVKALIRRFTTQLDVPEDTFLVYDLEELFKFLRNAASSTNGEFDQFHTVMAEYELIKDSFSFTPGLDCDFHKNLDGTSQFCSMSIVKRWAFTICDYCCEYLGVEMKPGVHLPLRYNYDEASAMSDSMSVLSEKIDLMQIQDTIGIKSMTGVSKEYRTRVSERTDAEEQRRRRDKTTVTIIKYGEYDNSAPVAKVEPKPEPPSFKEYQRPLRRPNSLSHALVAGKSKAAEEHSYNEAEFPSLGVAVGRGHGTKKKNNESRSGTGRGRGIALS